MAFTDHNSTDAYLRDHGLDPAAVGQRMVAAVRRALGRRNA